MITEHPYPQRSPEWFKVREGKITGTTLSGLFGRADGRETLMVNCLADMMSETDGIVANKAMLHGVNTEDLAKDRACEDLKINFRESGFITSDRLPGFGFSPDAIKLRDDYDPSDSRQNPFNLPIVGGLEIKCPDPHNHIRYMLGGEIPKKYYYQVMAPFVLSDDVEWWYFMSFDNRTYSRPTWYKRVDRDYFGEEKIDECREKIKQFHEELNEKYFELSLG